VRLNFKFSLSVPLSYLPTKPGFLNFGGKENETWNNEHKLFVIKQNLKIVEWERGGLKMAHVNEIAYTFSFQ
jgi:hypothetical protein